MLSGLSIGHLLVVLAVLLVVFGTGKLRSAGSDLGAAIKQFKRSVNDDADNQGTQKSKHSQDTAQQSKASDHEPR